LTAGQWLASHSRERSGPALHPDKSVRYNLLISKPMKYQNIKNQDEEIYNLIEKEKQRQKEGLELIPSENYTSPAVMESMGSILTNKYSEGYAKKRYYGGNEFIDNIELLAIERAKKLFGVEAVNVQPYSGSPANLAVYMATCQPGDVVLGLNLPDGGHLTHGWKVSATGLFYKTFGYHVKENWPWSTSQN
jgi:glycine hydroxymethyltransferase